MGCFFWKITAEKKKIYIYIYIYNMFLKHPSTAFYLLFFSEENFESNINKKIRKYLCPQRF